MFRRAWLRVAVLALAAAVFLFGAPRPGTCAEDEGAFASFVDATATPDDLLAALSAQIEKLRELPTTVVHRQVTVCAAAKADADRLAGTYAARWDASVARLTAAGWTAAADAPPVTVVFVRAAIPVADLLRDGKGRLLVRTPIAPAPTMPPAAPARADGPPVLRDALVAGLLCRSWAANAAAAAPIAPQSPDNAIARHLVDAVLAADAAPPWFREGLVGWLAASSLDPADQPSHVCRPPALANAAAAAALLGPAAPPPAARPFLAKLVGTLLDGVKDGPARVAALAGKPGAPGVESAFGKPFAATFDAVMKPPTAAPAAAGAAAPAAPRAPACNEQGAVPCPACKGRAKIEIACPECSGAGNLGCPACGGLLSCPYCYDGLVLNRGGTAEKCDACLGIGRHMCDACTPEKSSTKCRRCNGSGKWSVPCAGCVKGSIPCPSAGVPPETGGECPWCAPQKDSAQAVCGACRGLGHLGCRTCLGTSRFVCMLCLRLGAHSRTCPSCSGSRSGVCKDCSQGKRVCASCKGSGKSPPVASACPLCLGAARIGSALLTDAARRTPPLTGAEADASREALQKAQQFLLTCSTSVGFALRNLRRSDEGTAGELRDPTPYSNAETLWVLATCGADLDHVAMRASVARLRDDAELIISAKAEYSGVQAASQTLRALLVTGSKPDDRLVTGMVKRLVKAQRPNGLWAGDLDDPKDEPSPFDALFAAEALRAARLKGVKVGSEVWRKLASASAAALETRDLKVRGKGFVTGTDIASAAALAVIAKEGTLGKKATAFDYRSIPQVKTALAWLDRHFQIAYDPCFVNGARQISGSDAGHSAWLYAVQRLSMLLGIEDFGGVSWYAAGVRAVLPTQFEDGSFEERSRDALNGPVRTTTGVILFLVRATPAVTDADNE